MSAKRKTPASTNGSSREAVPSAQARAYVIPTDVLSAAIQCIAGAQHPGLTFAQVNQLVGALRRCSPASAQQIEEAEAAAGMVPVAMPKGERETSESGTTND